MISTAPFVLSRVTTPTDFTALVDCEFRTFTDPTLRQIFMGPDTPAGHSALAAKYASIASSNPGDIWIKVEEKSTGKLVAASNWRVHWNCVPEHVEDMGFEWLRGDEEAAGRARKVMGDIMETRKRLFTEPYCQLHICYTDPDYQRRGIGAMMLKWGCDLADQLFLPAWVEASPVGNFLYRAFGFKDVEVHEGGDVQGSVMKREARVLPIEGGKDAPGPVKVNSAV